MKICSSYVVGMLAVFLCATQPASAHRVDDYLQATTFILEKDHVSVRMRLTPGVAVAGKLLASIDLDADGIISEAEQRSYAQQVIRDLSFSIDGRPAQLELVSYAFATISAMKGGLGDIVLEMTATVPPAPQPER